MTRKAKRKNQLEKAFLFLLLCFVFFILTVEKKDMPKNLQDSAWAKVAYDARDSLLQRSKNMLEPRPEKKEKGYSDKDRKKIEGLINKGAQDH